MKIKSIEIKFNDKSINYINIIPNSFIFNQFNKLIFKL